jgi:hypothetical protein
MQCFTWCTATCSPSTLPSLCPPPPPSWPLLALLPPPATGLNSCWSSHRKPWLLLLLCPVMHQKNFYPNLPNSTFSDFLYYNFSRSCFNRNLFLLSVCNVWKFLNLYSSRKLKINLKPYLGCYLQSRGPFGRPHCRLLVMTARRAACSCSSACFRTAAPSCNDNLVSFRLLPFVYCKTWRSGPPPYTGYATTCLGLTPLADFFPYRYLLCLGDFLIC